jgi:hypothetical protein
VDSVRPNRVTGLQSYQLGLVRQIEAAKEQLGPADYRTLLDLHRRWLEAEIRRAGA